MIKNFENENFSVDRIPKGVYYTSESVDVKEVHAMYKNLRALRKSLGLTQEEMGRSIGIPKNTYYNYETQTNEPRSDFWAKISDKYNVSIDYLMDLTDDPRTYEQKQQETSEAKLVQITPEEAKLLAAFRAVPDVDRAMLLNMINIALQSRGLLPEEDK